ncbi:Thiol-disulfide isomerase or thioredoxin [Robiginitalea myxolifaciens]|uniref:Thiol-disulfide isomerase or thioredoxin n=1 Tax=Robiginitalea myxolifaciens TaxID=400055 RepID=A0A1I6GZK6_9FLAO|nr:TlpA disulfide reductase family protein [Robiginitalea myxolifaciens]SFR47547.1 Thiol-disulfide isomerase or thioredoxin [Robiginitalea myxolifaciens]
MKYEDYNKARPLALFSLLSLFLLLLAACETAAPNSYEITGELAGDLPQDTRLFLRKQLSDASTIDVDTAVITDGKFVFQGNIEIPELHFIFVEGQQGAIPLVLEEGAIWIEGHKDSLRLVRFGGSPQNEAYSSYLNGARELGERRGSINRDMQQAMMQKDTATMEALREEFFELQSRMNDFEKTFVEEHPDALISALLLSRILQNKTQTVATIKELYNGLTAEIQSSNAGMEIARLVESEGRTAIGSKAPAFSAPTPQGDTLALKDALGKYTLVDFWAGWCRPCRAENPNIVRVYHKYKDRGFTVFGVSLDRNEEQWVQAIEQDGLVWSHVSNVRYFDEIAALYNVRGIPASFLLDENGVIIAKNLRGPALEAKISELLD